ncbi:MAG: anthranilate synthase component I family protein [Tannerella sp.]|jgi:anthranilate synthase component 1|nr:anthranilate synthase component I family protein [Tannerella sp.]
MYRFKTIRKKLLGDLHTPVSVYLKLRDVYPKSALLESSDFHVNENSLSFIAICPLADIGINSGEVTATYPDGKKDVKPLSAEYSVPVALNDFLNRFDIEGDDRDYCGLFGYTAFDAVRYFEDIPVMEYHHKDTDAPDMYYILYKYMLVFDHFNNELTLIELCRENECDHLDEIETLIENRNFASYDFRTVGERTSSVTDEEYKAMVREGIRHCLRGDVFQIVLSRRFEQAYRGDDFKVYRSLRSINPSPYLFYFDFGGFRIFGSSPETHCKIENGHASIDPIAGTAFRTGNMVIDKQRVETLVNDPKENSEHVMLVDLARNDLSRNAVNVKVDFYREVQYYSHVMHLVSRVSGDIVSGSDSMKTFIDTFPAGTLSGAPKVRAMQLITGLEKHNRGAYGGCIGFIGLNGDLNQAITIRTFVSRSNVLYYQAGAGIVAKSNDERELEEVDSKLGALNKAIREAEKLKN